MGLLATPTAEPAAAIAATRNGSPNAAAGYAVEPVTAAGITTAADIARVPVALVVSPQHLPAVFAGHLNGQEGAAAAAVCAWRAGSPAVIMMLMRSHTSGFLYSSSTFACRKNSEGLMFVTYHAPRFNSRGSACNVVDRVCGGALEGTTHEAVQCSERGT